MSYFSIMLVSCSDEMKEYGEEVVHLGGDENHDDGDETDITDEERASWSFILFKREYMREFYLTEEEAEQGILGSWYMIIDGNEVKNTNQFSDEMYDLYENYVIND